MAVSAAMGILPGFVLLLAFGFVIVVMAYGQESDKEKWVAASNRKVAKAIFLVFLPALAVVTLSIGFAWDHNRRQLFIDGPNLVETGCLQLTPYREEFPIAHVSVRFERTQGRGSRDILKFNTGYGRRRLTVDLKESRYLHNLSIFAPSAMRRYAKYLEENGMAAPSAMAPIP